MNTQFVLGVIFAAISGIFLSLQAGCNSTLGKLAGKSFSSVVSFGTGLVCMLVFFLIDVAILQNKSPFHGGAVKDAPWWTWTGGFQGGFYVVTTIIFSEHTGASTLLGGVVSAQLICAFVLDNYGWAGFPKRKFLWPKIIGLGLMVMGVILVAVYKGDVITETESVEASTLKDTAAIEVTVKNG